MPSPGQGFAESSSSRGPGRRIFSGRGGRFFTSFKMTAVTINESDTLLLVDHQIRLRLHPVDLIRGH